MTPQVVASGRIVAVEPPVQLADGQIREARFTLAFCGGGGGGGGGAGADADANADADGAAAAAAAAASPTRSSPASSTAGTGAEAEAASGVAAAPSDTTTTFASTSNNTAMTVVGTGELLGLVVPRQAPQREHLRRSDLENRLANFYSLKNPDRLPKVVINTT